MAVFQGVQTSGFGLTNGDDLNVLIDALNAALVTAGNPMRLERVLPHWRMVSGDTFNAMNRAIVALGKASPVKSSGGVQGGFRLHTGDFVLSVATAAGVPKGGSASGGGVTPPATGSATPITMLGAIRTDSVLASPMAPVTLAAFSDLPVAAPNVITIDPTVTYQEIVGVGAALSDDTNYLLMNFLSSAARSALLQAVYGTLNFSMAVFPSTSTDCNAYSDTFSAGLFTLDDNGGVSDPTAAAFTTSVMPSYNFSALQAVFAVRPDLKMIVQPWTSPAITKGNNSLAGAANATITANANNFNQIANMAVKTCQALIANGTPAWAISPQNEPDSFTGTNGAPHAGFGTTAATSATNINSFIKTYLGPAVATAGLSVGIHLPPPAASTNVGDYGNTALADTTTAGYLTGFSTHTYEGNALIAPGGVARNNPTKKLYHTEFCYNDTPSNGSPTRPESPAKVMCDQVLPLFRNDNSSSYIFWNLLLPYAGAMPSPAVGRDVKLKPVVWVNADGSVTYNYTAYGLGHVAKYTQIGALRCACTSPGQTYGDTGIHTLGIVNPDGSNVVVLFNNAATSQTVTVQHGPTGSATQVTLAAKDLVTVFWPSSAPAAPVLGGPVSAASVTPTPNVPFSTTLSGMAGGGVTYTASSTDGTALTISGTTLSGTWAATTSGKRGTWIIRGSDGSVSRIAFAVATLIEAGNLPGAPAPTTWVRADKGVIGVTPVVGWEGQAGSKAFYNAPSSGPAYDALGTVGNGAGIKFTSGSVQQLTSGPGDWGLQNAAPGISVSAVVKPNATLATQQAIFFQSTSDGSGATRFQLILNTSMQAQLSMRNAATSGTGLTAGPVSAALTSGSVYSILSEYNSPAATSEIRLNGTATAGTAPSAATLQAANSPAGSIGGQNLGYGNSNCTMDIAEVRAFRGILTTLQKQMLEAGDAFKYGSGVDGANPWAAYPPTVLGLSAIKATHGVGFSAQITGLPPGATGVTATSSDGTTLTVTSGVVSGTFASAGSPTITLSATYGTATVSGTQVVTVA